MPAQTQRFRTETRSPGESLERPFFGRRDNEVAPKIAVLGGARTDGFGHVGHLNMRGSGVSLGKNGNRFDAQGTTGPDHPASNLSPVGDEYRVEGFQILGSLGRQRHSERF